MVLKRKRCALGAGGDRPMTKFVFVFVFFLVFLERERERVLLREGGG